MQVTIEVEPKTLSLLKEIERKGSSLDEVLREALNRFAGEAHLQETASADEWIESFKNWANNKRSLPNLSDEALRRENIYEDRI